MPSQSSAADLPESSSLSNASFLDLATQTPRIENEGKALICFNNRALTFTVSFPVPLAPQVEKYALPTDALRASGPSRRVSRELNG
jgi:hypothetical protein